MANYTHITDLTALVEIQPDSIVSRTFYKGATFKGVLFGFDAGQALSEHTSTYAATIQVLQGEATVTLDGESITLTPGGWVEMAPRLPHSVYAKTPLILLLLMVNANE